MERHLRGTKNSKAGGGSGQARPHWAALGMLVPEWLEGIKEKPWEAIMVQPHG